MKVEFNANRFSQQSFKSSAVAEKEPGDDRIRFEQVKLKKQLLQTQYSQDKLGVMTLYKQGFIDKEAYKQKMQELQNKYMKAIDLLDTKEKELQFCYYL